LSFLPHNDVRERNCACIYHKVCRQLMPPLKRKTEQFVCLDGFAGAAAAHFRARLETVRRVAGCPTPASSWMTVKITSMP
jgi:hypothetical protein